MIYKVFGLVGWFMRVVAPIRQTKLRKERRQQREKKVMRHVSCFTCNVSHVTCT